jgi:hypothetical protein
MSGEEVLTVGQVARRLNVDSWHVRRIFERHLLAEPPRFGRARVIRVADLPELQLALVTAGYLSEPEAAGGAA